MSDSYIFEITVYGKMEEIYYPIIFRIMLKFGRYSVWLVIGNISIQCGFFDRKIDSFAYIRSAMKSAMFGKFLFRECIFCDSKNYYPKNVCNACETIIYPYNSWQVEDLENEKKTLYKEKSKWIVKCL